jgi:hypothetical protein
MTDTAAVARERATFNSMVEAPKNTIYRAD